MKVGIITCHDVCNYGSTLQAYALSCQLEQMGAEVSIIDYIPDYIYRLVDFMKVDSPRWQTALWRRWAYRLRMVPRRMSLVPKYFRYRRFNKKYLNITKKRYNNEKSLHELQGYDAFVCGSDQIWSSVRNKCGEDGAFFLSFARQEKKISYAASFGAAEISPAGEECVKKYLPDFDAISVREASGVSLLEQYGIAATQVVDPVFLMEKGFWNALAKPLKKLPERYVLVYGYDSSANLSQIAAEQKDLPVVSLGNVTYGGYGPEEFLYMIKNASLVVTSSFHAVAFSLIFETPFVVIKTGNAPLFERLSSILKLTGLENQIWNPGKPVSHQVDFTQSRAAIAHAKSESIRFLEEALYGTKNS